MATIEAAWKQVHDALAPRFGVTEVNEQQLVVMEEASHQLLHIATNLAISTPPSRELSSALTHLEEAKFWASAAISRNGTVQYEDEPTAEQPDGEEPDDSNQVLDEILRGPKLTVLPGGLPN